MKPTEYKITDRELNLLINYIRAEARLSAELEKVLWLSKEKNEIMKKCVSLGERFKYLKSDLRHNFSKEIYQNIIKEDKVETTSLQCNPVRLKKDE
jgi:hypothetical protein